MQGPDAPPPTPPISRRQLLRGVGAGVGVLAVGTPVARAAGRFGCDVEAAATRVEGSGGLRGTIRGAMRVAATTIDARDTLRFDPSRDTVLEVSGNLIVEGRLVMRPQRGVTHILRFVDVDESAFVGGGMDPIDSDVGLWVMGDGILDVEGTRKQSWNRSGDHATWTRNDDLVVAPIRPGDFTPKRFRKGARVPAFRGRRAEVLNLTRNVRIEGRPGGRAHIFIRSSSPQSIRNATLRHLGPRQPSHDGTESVLGRYGLHFHHCLGGSRGSVVEGVVVRDCGGHAFVPHRSHGITIRDCISYETFDDAYWWDPNEATNDLLIDRCVAASVHFDPEIHGYRLAGFMLGDGERLRIRDSVAFAVHGNGTAAGYVWPEAHSGVWGFRNNIAHNNKIAGIFVWQNVREPHDVDNFTAFNNGRNGIIHGAYLNAYHYRDLDLRDQPNAIQLHAASRLDTRGNPQSWIDVEGGTLEVVRHNLPGEVPALFRRCSFPGGVIIDDGDGEGGALDFVDCDLARGDFRIRSMHPATVVRIQRRSGSALELTSTGSRDIRPFIPY